MLARVARLQSVVAALRGDRTPLAELALKAGFADQAHLTREVAAPAGITPAQYRADTFKTRSIA